MSSTRVSIGSVLLAGVLFGTTGTAGALGPPGTTPQGVGAIRLVVGAAALVLAMALRGGRPGQLLRLWREPAVVVAAASAAVYQVCFFSAIERVGVGLGTLLTVGSGPVFAGLLGWAILRHRPTAAWVLATLVCVVGLVLRSWDVLAAGLGEGAPAGLGLALAAGASSAAWTTAAKHQLDRGVAPLELTTASFALGGLLLIPVLLGQPLDWVLQQTGLALALYLGVATFAIANLILGYGLAGLTPGPATTLMLSDPLVATLLGVAVLGETLDAAAWLGLALVLAGLALQGLSLARERPADAGPVPAPTL